MTFATRLPTVLTVLGVLAVIVPVLAAAKPDPKPRPPKPKPTVELLTDSQEGALRKRQLKVSVQSRRGNEAKVWATLTVDGDPAADYAFELGRKQGKLRGGETKFAYRLNAREHEVLEFAALTCREAQVNVRAKVKAGKRAGTDAIDRYLERPADCRSGR